MCEIDYLEKDYNQINYLIDDDLILIVTATNLETENLHKYLFPISGFEKLLKVHEGNQTFYFGMFGLYKVAHVQCAMGSISPSSSILTVSESLGKFNSKIVLMVGIAFGVNKEKQKIGDVLIAESVIPYNSKRIGTDETINRGVEMPSSQLLLNRFKNIRDWGYFIDEENKPSIIFTRLLSGEELIDNKLHRDKLVNAFPNSEGGEMEGAGVYSACNKSKTDCIIVKGICDFADGKKGKNKKINQNIAVISAINLCLELFNSETAFNKLGVFPFTKKSNDEVLLISDDILFDFYTKENEPYYIERTQDKTFVEYLNNFGLWIYGPSGCGKSNLIARNLIKNEIEYIQIDLSVCIGQDVDVIFKEILLGIQDYLNVPLNNIPKDFIDISKSLLNTLENNFANKEIVIFVEEIPIGDKVKLKEFSEKLFSILTSKNLHQNLNKVRFVLSCIDNPKIHLNSFQKKIHQHLVFMELKYWCEDDIEILINLIKSELKINLENSIIESIKTNSKGSPRFIKKFFRSILSLNAKDNTTINLVLNETIRELN